MQLQYCSNCLQMTNNKNNICSKCNMEDEIIKRFREEVKQICYKEGATSVQDFAEQFILSELKALKEECSEDLYDYGAEKNSDITGAILIINKAFAKRGV